MLGFEPRDHPLVREAESDNRLSKPRSHVPDAGAIIG